jgi:soluble P-type ATPase
LLRALSNLPVTIRIVRAGRYKRRVVETLGARNVAAVGNGVNDVPMLRAAALGIAVLGTEGTSGELLRVATVVVRDIDDAIDLLLRPQRLVATLRK